MSKCKKIVSLCLAAAMLLAACMLTGCDTEGGSEERDYGDYYRPETQTVDQSLLPGMMYIVNEGYNYNNVDYVTGLETMKNLGVKRIRFDTPGGDAFPDLTTRAEDRIQTAHDIIAEAEKNGIEMIADCLPYNYFFDKGWVYSVDGAGVPRRDTAEGSYYNQWLQGVGEMMYTIVSEFKEIVLWELGNEPNGTPYTYLDGTVATMQETAVIYADLMYVCAEAVHRADPDDLTVMGGLTELSGLGTTGGNASFLQDIYDYIYSDESPSQYADDYFQIACWHPYTFTDMDPDYFVEQNQKVYDVIVQNEGKDKKVIFSEFGFSDATVSQQAIVQFIYTMFETIRERMPYVETICWFRAFNDYNDRGWGGDTTLVMYGLFYDPNYEYEGSGDNKYKGTLYIPGEPKPQAYAYQACAGGSGDLTLMMLSRESIIAMESAATLEQLGEDGLPVRYGKDADGNLLTYTYCLTRTKELFEQYKPQ